MGTNGGCFTVYRSFGPGGGRSSASSRCAIVSPTVCFALLTRRPRTCLGMSKRKVKLLRPGGGGTGGVGLGGGEALAGVGMEMWFGGITSAGVSAQPSGPV